MTGDPIPALFAGLAVLSGLLCLVGGLFASQLNDRAAFSLATKHVTRLALGAAAATFLALWWPR